MRWKNIALTSGRYEMEELPQGNGPHGPAQSIDDAMAKWVRREALEADIQPLNKTNILDALDAVGIASVVIRFDGYCDSGQIEEICAENSEGHSLQLPAAMVEIFELPWDSEEAIASPMKLIQALETHAYHLLRSTHPGWENNDGAYGEFTFDVAAGVIRLDHYDRYVETEEYNHEF